jgi:hypothetical protein
MVADNRPQSHFRLCPDLGSEARDGGRAASPIDRSADVEARPESGPRATPTPPLAPALAALPAPALPLMQHHITVDTCERRQDRGYHKCHRCVHQDLALATRRGKRLGVEVLRAELG